MGNKNITMNHTRTTKGIEVIHRFEQDGITATWSSLEKWLYFYDGKPLDKNKVSGMYLPKNLFTTTNIKKLFAQELRFKNELENFKR